MRPHYRTRPFSPFFNSLHQRERAARSPSTWRWRRAYTWSVAVAAGLVAGAMGFALNWFTEALALVKYRAAANHIEPHGAHGLL